MELDKPGGLSGFTDTADISRYSDFSLASGRMGTLISIYRCSPMRITLNMGFFKKKKQVKQNFCAFSGKYVMKSHQTLSPWRCGYLSGFQVYTITNIWYYTIYLQCMRRKWHYYKQPCGTNLSNDFIKYHFVRYVAGPKIDILIKNETR